MPNFNYAQSVSLSRLFFTLTVMYDLEKIEDPKQVRLAMEHIKLIELCKRDANLSFEVLDLYDSINDRAYSSKSLLRNNPPIHYLSFLKA